MVLAYDFPLLSALLVVTFFFLWIAWIIVLFRTVIDVFRSQDMSGFAKAFWLLFIIVAISLVWMHFAVLAMEREAAEAGVPVKKLPQLPEMQPIHVPAHGEAMAGTGAIQDWRPEDKDYWEGGGRAIARRNLWISIPCLLLFCIANYIVVPGRDNLSVFSICSLFPNEVGNKVIFTKYFIANLDSVYNFTIVNGTYEKPVVGK